MAQPIRSPPSWNASLDSWIWRHPDNDSVCRGERKDWREDRSSLREQKMWTVLKKKNKSDMRKNVKMTVRPLLLQAAFQNACTSIQYRHILRNYLKVCKVESNCLFLHVSLCTVFVSKSFLCLLPVTVFPVAAWQCYSTESHSAEAFSACYVALLQVESGLSIRSAAQQPIKWGCIKNNLFKKTVYSEARSQTYGNTDF